MEISARNQLKGKIVSIRIGDLMAEVVLDVGGHGSRSWRRRPTDSLPARA